MVWARQKESRSRYSAPPAAAAAKGKSSSAAAAACFIYFFAVSHFTHYYCYTLHYPCVRDDFLQSKFSLFSCGRVESLRGGGGGGGAETLAAKKKKWWRWTLIIVMSQSTGFQLHQERIEFLKKSLETFDCLRWLQEKIGWRNVAVLLS